MEVHAIATDGSARATWKLTDAWVKGALQAAPSHDYAVATLGAGSNAGAPPAGWSVALTASGTSNVVIYSMIIPRDPGDDRPGPRGGPTASLPLAEGPCPSCTALVDQLDGAAEHAAQRVNLADGRSPADVGHEL